MYNNMQETTKLKYYDHKETDIIHSTKSLVYKATSWQDVLQCGKCLQQQNLRHITTFKICSLSATSMTE